MHPKYRERHQEDVPWLPATRGTARQAIPLHFYWKTSDREIYEYSMHNGAPPTLYQLSDANTASNGFISVLWCRRLFG